MDSVSRSVCADFLGQHMTTIDGRGCGNGDQSGSGGDNWDGVCNIE